MANKRVLVWDIAVRGFHWLLALSFLGALVTSESERYRDVHVMLGYTMLGLIGFRLVWALVGTRYARIASFAFGPRQVAGYLKSLLSGRPRHYLGHNPAGSWAIYALVGLTLIAGATGYAAYNDLGGHWMKELHEGAANTLIAAVVVHLVGVAVSSLLHRENLVRAMITGYKDAADEGPARRG
jgi:cytochrome b